VKQLMLTIFGCLVRRDHWREDAACLNQPMALFFPHHTLTEDRWDVAKHFCSSCIVKDECLGLVINLEEHDDRWGLFGGYTPTERRVLRDERRKAK
jgi:hypothetical protein